MCEERVFLLCDDNCDDLVLGKITRTQSEVINPLWSLEIGDVYQPDPQNPFYFMRCK